MKKHNLFFLLLTAIVIFSLSSCDCIKGEGHIIEESRNLGNFTSIDLNISAQVIITKDTACSFTIKAQENLLSYIKTNVSGGELEVDFKSGCYRTTEPIFINVSMKEITSLEVDGSGSFYSKDRFDVEKIDLEIDGSGEIDMQLFADKINAEISGSGDIKLKGTAKKFKVDINGSGDVDAEDLMAYKAYVYVSGSGNCNVFVHELLDVSISGSGDVYYSGSPEIKTHINGSGSLDKIR